MAFRKRFSGRRAPSSRFVRSRPAKRRARKSPVRRPRQQVLRIVIEQPGAGFDQTAAMLGQKVAASPKKARF